MPLARNKARQIAKCSVCRLRSPRLKVEEIGVPVESGDDFKAVMATLWVAPAAFVEFAIANSKTVELAKES